METHRVLFAALAAQLAATAVFAQAARTDLVLERAIGQVEPPGAVVTLVGADDRCRYVGALERSEVPASGFAASVLASTGADRGAWAIAITTRACGDVAEPVRLRVMLPRPPSQAGGGGLPPLPLGYEAGTRMRAIAE